MSTVERNKGKLIPQNIDTELFDDEASKAYEENGFVVIDGEIYAVEWKVKRETDCDYFADVKQNEDGSIDFLTYHYNGGGHWTEVVEDALEESK